MSTTTPLPTEEQKARARWDLLLSDLEYRAEQSRLARAQTELAQHEIWFKPWQAVFTGLAAGAGIFAAGAAVFRILQ